MDDFDRRIAAAAAALGAAERIVAGGGAGLSAAAGLEYGGARFDAHFADFKQAYGIADMYAGMFYPFATAEERWAHHARHIYVNRFEPAPLPLYRTLKELTAGRETFVVTTNVESQFVKSGFAPERVFEVQGNYGLLQCSRGCHEGLYDDRALVEQMVRATEHCRIPTEMVPKCPVCGREMAVHVRVDNYFVEDEAWRRQSARYENFLGEAAAARTVFLELGVGYNTPGIIRFPFEQMVSGNPRATLVRLNRDDPEGPPENRARTLSFAEPMEIVLTALNDAVAGVSPGGERR